MRVKIAFTVDIDEVEEEVVTIMQKALSDIDKASDFAFDATSKLSRGNEDINIIINQMDEARKRLSKADQVIMDCYEILKAYKETLAKLEQEVEDE
mgnify:CR=1 FL=1